MHKYQKLSKLCVITLHLEKKIETFNALQIGTVTVSGNITTVYRTYMYHNKNHS